MQSSHNHSHPLSNPRRVPEPHHPPTQAVTTYSSQAYHIHHVAQTTFPPQASQYAAQPSGFPSIVRTTAQPTFCPTYVPGPTPTRLPPPVTRSYHPVQTPSRLGTDKLMFPARQN